MTTELVPVLQRLGFSEYEAKAYLALLRRSPLSGYAVARDSGVPRSKIYQVLGGLTERGEVLVSYGEPTQYAPLPWTELIGQRRRASESLLLEAERGLARYTANGPGSDRVWTITGREEILERMRELIGRAERQVLLEVWPEDAPAVHDALAAAAGRGVMVIVIAFGEVDFPFARVYRHDVTDRDDLHRGVPGRLMVLSVDAHEVVHGLVSHGSESKAAWSAHPGLAVPVTELLKHDLYLAEILAAHRELLEASFGPGLIGLRDAFSLATNATSTVSQLSTSTPPGAVPATGT